MRQTEDKEKKGEKEKVVVYIETRPELRERVKKVCRELSIDYSEFLDLFSYLYAEDPLVRETVHEEVMSRRQEFGEFEWKPASKE